MDKYTKDLIENIAILLLNPYSLMMWLGIIVVIFSFKYFYGCN